MRKLRLVLVPLVCFFSAIQALAAGSPTVYVSTGLAGKIFAVNTSNGKATALVSTTGADYEGMVVGPDSAPGTAHPFLLYVCDTANNQIIRFDPTAKKISVEVIYSGVSPTSVPLTKPQCGRITATGDLVVTSANSNAGGLWVFPGITTQELGFADTVPGPTHVFSGDFEGEGLAQKNIGDILVVDATNGNVLRLAAPGFGSASPLPFISGLSSPMGIARRSDGAVFVSSQNTGANTGTVKVFDGQNPGTPLCSTPLNISGTPYFMQSSLDDTVYLGVKSGTSGFVQTVSAVTNPATHATTCSLGGSFSLSYPAIGIALPPTSATQPVNAANGTSLVSFGFAAFELNQLTAGCAGTITVNLASPLAISNLISLAGGGATPAVNLGLDGFEAVFSTANLNDKCTAKDGVTTNFQIANFVSSVVDSPQIVVCNDQNTNCQPQAVNLLEIGSWPVEGYLPQDYTAGGSKSLKCNVFLVNSQPPVTEPGTFCTFESPLSNAYHPATALGQPTYPWDQALATTVSAGKSVPVKFRLSPTGGSCGSAPYITDAIAILSVALLPDLNGHVFTPIGLVSNGSSGLGRPLFKSDGNQNYLFNWDTSSCIMPSGKTQVCPTGTYSVSVQLLTNNTSGSGDSIYTTQTTLVVLK